MASIILLLKNTAHLTCESKYQNNHLFVIVFSTREIKYTIHYILLLLHIENITHIWHKFNIILGTASYHIIVRNLHKMYIYNIYIMNFAKILHVSCQGSYYIKYPDIDKFNKHICKAFFKKMFIKIFVQIKHTQHMKLHFTSISPGKCLEINICILILPASTSIK